jgi:hypothetical protein
MSKSKAKPQRSRSKTTLCIIDTERGGKRKSIARMKSCRKESYPKEVLIFPISVRIGNRYQFLANIANRNPWSRTKSKRQNDLNMFFIVVSPKE